ncbi:zinc finger and BTB domain-containing protein 11-like [Bicyclus anynana]|uniref:Zinc finger and BTB domain-containing protein 11-like n=1 Tax=Bicyclus anynana TaxID=110368 RepID=A0A6J1MZ26_BICAN|nr:zinc finger and BTB domain-containing protein 11-like [Bicyclus anynana]
MTDDEMEDPTNDEIEKLDEYTENNPVVIPNIFVAPIQSKPAERFSQNLEKMPNVSRINTKRNINYNDTNNEIENDDEYIENDTVTMPNIFVAPIQSINQSFNSKTSLKNKSKSARTTNKRNKNSMVISDKTTVKEISNKTNKPRRELNVTREIINDDREDPTTDKIEKINECIENNSGTMSKITVDPIQSKPAKRSVSIKKNKNANLKSPNLKISFKNKSKRARINNKRNENSAYDKINKTHCELNEMADDEREDTTDDETKTTDEFIGNNSVTKANITVSPIQSKPNKRSAEVIENKNTDIQTPNLNITSVKKSKPAQIITKLKESSVKVIADTVQKSNPELVIKEEITDDEMDPFEDRDDIQRLDEYIAYNTVAVPNVTVSPTQSEPANRTAPTVKNNNVGFQMPGSSIYAEKKSKSAQINTNLKTVDQKSNPGLIIKEENMTDDEMDHSFEDHDKIQRFVEYIAKNSVTTPNISAPKPDSITSAEKKSKRVRIHTNLKDNTMVVIPEKDTLNMAGKVVKLNPELDVKQEMTDDEMEEPSFEDYDEIQQIDEFIAKSAVTLPDTNESTKQSEAIKRSVPIAKTTNTNTKKPNLNITKKKSNPVGVNTKLKKFITAYKKSRKGISDKVNKPVARKAVTKKDNTVNKDKANKPKIVPEKEKHCLNLETLLTNSNATPIQHYDGSDFLCCFCSEGFSKSGDLKEHTSKNHRNKKSISAYIKKTRPSTFLLKLDVTLLKCTVCEKKIDTVDNLFDHLQNEHKQRLYADVKNRIVPFNFESEGFKCAICSLFHTKYKNLLEHMHSHYRNYVCDVCDRGFISSRAMLCHQQSHEKSSVGCSKCDKVFENVRRLKLHMAAVHRFKNLPNKCKICNERFTSTPMKDQHMSTVHGKSPIFFKCLACEKSFKNQYSLRIHTKKYHLMERRYQCTQCEKTFFTGAQLRSHTLRHTGVKDFQCDYCSRLFARKTVLSAHMRLHMNNWLYTCHLCDKGFVQKWSWTEHVQTVHGKKEKKLKKKIVAKCNAPEDVRNVVSGKKENKLKTIAAKCNAPAKVRTVVRGKKENKLKKTIAAKYYAPSRWPSSVDHQKRNSGRQEE